MLEPKECLELFRNRKQKRAPNMACIDKDISGSSEANLGHGSTLGWAALLGFGHFAIELGCSCSLNEILDRSEFGGSGIQLFNVLAFLPQPIIGLAGDRWNTAKPIAILGGILVSAVRWQRRGFESVFSAQETHVFMLRPAHCALG